VSPGPATRSLRRLPRRDCHPLAQCSLNRDWSNQSSIRQDVPCTHCTSRLTASALSGASFARRSLVQLRRRVRQNSAARAGSEIISRGYGCSLVKAPMPSRNGCSISSAHLFRSRSSDCGCRCLYYLWKASTALCISGFCTVVCQDIFSFSIRRFCYDHHTRKKSQRTPGATFARTSRRGPEMAGIAPAPAG
jgi:hypothetical protein